jgi:hypothetical protein
LQDKKNAEEGEKKAQLLYDQLGAHQVPTPIIEELLQIIKGIYETYDSLASIRFCYCSKSRA